MNDEPSFFLLSKAACQLLFYVLAKSMLVVLQIENMFSIMELYMNQVGLYVTDARQAEKKALNFLIIYAVLMNRHKLAKMLWKRSEDPIPVRIKIIKTNETKLFNN